MSESLLQEYAAADRSSRDAMAESPEVPSFIDDYAAELHNMYRTILKERDTAKMSAGFRRDAINDREASLEIMERQSAVSARTIEQLRNKLHDMEIANKSLAAVPTPRTPNSPYSPHTPSARSRRMTPSTPSSPKRQLRSPLHTPAIQRQPLG